MQRNIRFCGVRCFATPKVSISSFHFVNLIDFDNYEISIEEPHIIRDKNTHNIIEEWYNKYGDAAILLDGELYLVSDLVRNQF